MNEVRVRFAPSPTGWLHVGGARTAYFNWLFARQRGGAFVLRIEDTDVERSNVASEQGVLDDLRWLALEWNEGPDVGGPHGPYRQSERLPLYRERADALLAGARAYPCFCTDAELEARRVAALAAGRPPQYDGHCRNLTEGERAERRREGRPESLRFKTPSEDQLLHDLVRGEVRFPSGMVGDFVLLRSSGLPTYNFACVVDDSHMRISHVIRAEEHLSNTARQLMLYAAFGMAPPAFAHVPLILNPDRTKMSKRGGEASVAVGDWRAAGFTPEALLSYLALLGFHPGDDREILSREDLLEAFTLDRVGRSGSVFDAAKLRWVNSQTLHHMSGAELARRGAHFLPERALEMGEGRLEQMIEAVRGNLATLADLGPELEPYLAEMPRLEPDARAALGSQPARDLCGELSREIHPRLDEWGGDVFKSAVQTVGKRLGLKGKDLYMPVRAALTGRTHGPELPVVAELLGGLRCERRLELAAAGGHPGEHATP
ncbi:MAG: glutamate--tRNA ligase [Candidatus Eiseniibacteriota bacterium]